jgi:crossover junction endodeoxyribonuclease RusA
MARRATQRIRTDLPPAFEVCVHGQPVSAQTARRQALQAWKHRVREACEKVWADQPPIEDQVIIRVTHYCETVIGDVDNLTKPIQDALQGVVYQDDRQVSDTIGNRRNIDASFRVRYMSMALAAAFSDGRQFVHIRVSRSPRRQDLG